MPNKMLIDATHPEETRVVVVRGNRVEEFDFETAQRKQLRGNIYLAKVTRVEPSLQAAFVEYGGNRHGFLAFSEIHPDYYQIPVADRQALIEAEERAHREAEEESENRGNRRRSRHRNSRRRGHGDRVRSEVIDAQSESQTELQGIDPVAADSDTFQQAAAAPEQPAEGAPFGSSDSPQGEQASEAIRPSAGPDVIGESPEAQMQRPVSDSVPDAPLEGPAASIDNPVEAQFDPATATAPVAPHHDDEGRAPSDAPAMDSPDTAPTNGDEDHLGDAASYSDADNDEDGDEEDDEDEDDAEDAEEEHVESVGGDDALEEVPERAFRPRRQYKIQEVIKRRQVMLVQVVKEERGNKGAALTTYLSLAGRYAVLMPNTARGGGISRKITSAQDRARLKDVVQDLDVPEGMGIILRTAGASRTKPEIKRDFEYLLRLWETVRDLTLRSQAPSLVYEEGSLIKRSLRDLYNKEIDEIIVAGEAGYREARDFMQMLMPSHVRAVKLYRDGQPLFSRMGVESQLDAMFSPTVQLKSGGYIVINQTEALVSIDVNSGRSTREHHIEDTALKTNLEAAEEVARQLRLRDLAGLIVVDFIDMEEKRNNRAVERKLAECLRQDRARIQVGRISHFGLLEMSRQRIRASVLESSTEPCPHCGGTGHVRSVASVALQLLRGVEEALMKGATHNLVVRTRADVALYVLNHKRGHLRDLEDAFKITLSILSDPSVSGLQSYVIEKGDQVHTAEAARSILTAQLAAAPIAPEEVAGEEEAFESEAEVETEETMGLAEEAADDNGEADSESEGEGRRRRRRRRRRGRGGEAREAAGDEAGALAGAELEIAAEDGDEAETADEPAGDEADAVAGETLAEGERRPRRRGRRGGRRRRGFGPDAQDGDAAPEAAFGEVSVDLIGAVDNADDQPIETAEQSAAAQSMAEPLMAEMLQPAAEPAEPVQPLQQAEPVKAEPAQDARDDSHADDSRPRRRSTVREKVSFGSSAPSPAPVAVAAEAPQPAPEPAQQPDSAAPSAGEPAPRRAGWWSRRFGGG